MKVKMTAGWRKPLLKAPGVRADIRRRADKIARAAGPGFVAEVYDGTPRWRASVRTDTYEAMVDEAENRTLTRAFDAGRG